MLNRRGTRREGECELELEAQREAILRVRTSLGERRPVFCWIVHRVVIRQSLSYLLRENEKKGGRRKRSASTLPSLPSHSLLASGLPTSTRMRLTASQPFQQSHLEQNHLNPAWPCCCCWSCLDRVPSRRPPSGRFGTAPASKEVL